MKINARGIVGAAMLVAGWYLSVTAAFKSGHANGSAEENHSFGKDLEDMFDCVVHGGEGWIENTKTGEKWNITEITKF